MKHIILVPSTSMNGAANAVTRVVPSSKAMLAPLAALLITAVALATSGCSKNKNSQNASQNQPVPQSVSNQNLAATAAAPSSIPVLVKQPDTGSKKSVKGPVKRLASVRTFKNVDAGVSFLYPRTATLKAGEKAEQDLTSRDRLPMSYIGPGGSTLASVEFPSDKQEQMGNLFLLNANDELTSDQCNQFLADSRIDSGTNSAEASVNQRPSLTPGEKTTFHGVEYSELDKQNDQSVIRYYHRFLPQGSADKGVCYEFGMLVSAETKQDADSTSSAEHKDVFAKLEKILASVKIDNKSSEGAETVKSESKKPAEVIETAKTGSLTTADSAVKNADDNTTEGAKAIAKDESPR